ncbi:MAG: hypothetical protein HKM24_03080 [Gammaproteobacteria bacterium]|nr:hypothetical protein [Gammaproteobacteria bacterium]
MTVIAYSTGIECGCKQCGKVFKTGTHLVGAHVADRKKDLPVLDIEQVSSFIVGGID